MTAIDPWDDPSPLPLDGDADERDAGLDDNEDALLGLLAADFAEDGDIDGFGLFP